MTYVMDSTDTWVKAAASLLTPGAFEILDTLGIYEMFGPNWTSFWGTICDIVKIVGNNDLCENSGISITEIPLNDTHIDWNAAHLYNLRNHSSASVKNLLHWA